MTIVKRHCCISGVSVYSTLSQLYYKKSNVEKEWFRGNEKEQT